MTSNTTDAKQSTPAASRLILTGPDRSRVDIYRYGAHVTSWIDRTGREQFFLSPLAGYSNGVSIRGGIPVVFPQFAMNGPLPKHGLLRTRVWDVTHQDTSSAIFRITDDDATRKLWPYRFLAELHVTLSDTLTVALHVTNTGDSPFTFTSALHNYFHVDDVSAAAVEGLTGCAYRDKVIDGPAIIDTARAVHIDGETDRVYIDGPREVHITNVAGDRALHIAASGFGDWVVWNPGPELTKQLADMEPEGYRRMLCVEAALVRAPQTLAPGTTWVGTQQLRT